MRRLGATAVAAVETRLGLVGTDVEKEVLRLGKILLWGAVCLFFLFVGIALLVVLAVVLAGEEHRVLVLAVLSGLSLAVALAVALGLRAWMRTQPKPFQATLAELVRDRERMGS